METRKVGNTAARRPVFIQNITNRHGHGLDVVAHVWHCHLDLFYVKNYILGNFTYFPTYT
jgi:hypothetical protein